LYCELEDVITHAAYAHIVKRANESARLEKHPRTRVAMLVNDYQGRGWSVEEIVRQYPYLTEAEVHSALAYYFDHREEIDQEIAGEAAEYERLRKAAPETATLKRLRALKAKRTG
jgi:uncharacterized protein (DUF433 family)